MTSTRPVSGTSGTARTSTAPGTTPRGREVAGPTPPVKVPEHRASAQLGILGVLGLCVTVCLWVVWRTGPNKFRALDLFEATARGWPTVTVPADGQYILRAPLGPILYRLVPVHGPSIFLGLHAVCLLASGALLAAWLCRRLGRTSGLVAAMIVALAPVTAVLLLFIGLYDAFSILAWVVVLVSLGRRPSWQLAAGVLAGIQDFEQIGVGLLLVALLPGLARAAGLRPRVGALLGGAVAGKFALEIYLHAVGAGSGSRLTYLARWDVFSGLLGSAAADAPLLLWSALAGLWGFALKALHDSWGSWRCQQRAGLILAAGLWFATGALSWEHTRVLALTSFPLVVMGAMAIAQRWPDLRELARLPQTWLLVLPPVVLVDFTTVQMGIKPGTWGIWMF